MDNWLILVEAPVVLLQLLIDGLLIGAIFALIAYGMALVWGVMNLINVAQGEFVILGGYISYSLVHFAGFGPLYTLPLVGLALFIIGWLIYKTIIFRLVERDLFTSLLATFGISILLQQLMNQWFGADVVNTTLDLDSWELLDAQIIISPTKVIAFIASISIGIGIYVFLKYSTTGLAIRATAQNAKAAKLLGVNTDRVYAMTFGLNAALCGLAGTLVVIVWVIHPFIGLVYTVRSFAIVIIAGLGNIIGVTVSALGLGALENTAGFILGTEFQSAFLFSLLVIILVVRNILLRRQRRYLQ